MGCGENLTERKEEGRGGNSDKLKRKLADGTDRVVKHRHVRSAETVLAGNYEVQNSE